MSLVLIGKDLLFEAKERTNGFQVFIFYFHSFLGKMKPFFKWLAQPPTRLTRDSHPGLSTFSTFSMRILFLFFRWIFLVDGHPKLFVDDFQPRFSVGIPTSLIGGHSSICQQDSANTPEV